ncbi:MAG: hypothetical protein OQJ97_09770 [Rhodospirillales bacterium]|nr:hypothetical protein [Rhodospirillales bacterium]
MSITSSEVARSIFGAYRMARFDPKGLSYFDVSVEGFYKSFYAAAFIAPFYAIVLLIRYSSPEMEAGPLRYIVIETIGYSIAWTVFPVIMISLSKLFDRQEYYVQYIVAYNWSAVIQNLLYLPIAILAELELIPSDAANFIALMIISAILFYIWFITRTALNVPPGTATGIVVFDTLLGVFINVWVHSML